MPFLSRPVKPALAISAGAIASALVGCGSDSPLPPPPPPASIAPLPGAIASEVEVGRSAGSPVFVVTDRDGRPRAGVPVTFTPLGTGAMIAQSVDTTDSQGHASPGAWIVGRQSGRDSLVAAVPGGPHTGVGIGVRPGALAQLVPSSPTFSSNLSFTPHADPVFFTARDRFGNPVPGVTVRFTTSAPPQSAPGSIVEPTSTVTDAHGVARVASWMFLLAGTNVLTASNESGAITGTITKGNGTIGGCNDRRVLSVPYVGTDSYDAATCPALGRAGTYLLHVRERSFVRFAVEAPASANARLFMYDFIARRRYMGQATPSVRALLVPAIYQVYAGDFDRTASAPLSVTLRGESVPESVTGCEPLWLPFEEVSTTQSWSATDCNGPVLGLDSTRAWVHDVFRFDVQVLDTIPPVQLELETSAPGDIRLVLSGDRYQYQSDGSTRLVDSLDTIVPVTDGRAVLARQFTYRYERHTVRIAAPAGTTGTYTLRIRRLPGTGIVRN